MPAAKSTSKQKSFHAYGDSSVMVIVPTGAMATGKNTNPVTVTTKTLAYDFDMHAHPFVAALTHRLLERSIPGLLGADTEYRRKANGEIEEIDGEYRPVLYDDRFFEASYSPSPLVSQKWPVKELEFDNEGAYSVYNWELFFHIPLTIAIHLSKNGRYAESRKWFHTIFDPTDASSDPTPERFWRVRPFQYTEVRQIEEILINLVTGDNAQLRQTTIDSIGAWKDAPFRPHVVARYRQSAYMLKTLMAYLDNLIAWGDSLFAQDTRETILEASGHYIQAANLLGASPQSVPSKGTLRPQTYASLRADLDEFGNALRELETDIPFVLTLPPGEVSDGSGLDSLRGIGRALYFAVPPNDKLLGYWKTVADRFFKIHNSLNLQGIFRQLPMFEAAIDPRLVAAAVQAGVDVAAVASGANQPIPSTRFLLLVQKAAEITQEVKALGTALLGVMEKEDNETLAILRAQHERTILDLGEVMRYGQLLEARKSREALDVAFVNAIEKYVYYERLLGGDEQVAKTAAPALDPPDATALKKGTLDPTEPTVAGRNIEIDISPIGEAITGGRKLSTPETLELGLSVLAQTAQTSGTIVDALGSLLGLIPQVQGRVTPWGLGVGADFGGVQLSKVASAAATTLKGTADLLNFGASMSSKMANFARREQEWSFQSKTAVGEINHLYKQIRAAQIREAVAERELESQRRQMKNAEEIEQFLTDERTGKKTGKSLYAWMRREVKGLHGQCFQLALDVAKKAERALQHELGDPTASYVRGGYLGGREGLLAGEKLYLDVKRMEMAYHDLNRREYELTRNISLLQLDPLALLRLRMTGRCVVTIPEELFDMDGAGRYFRRIKSVSVTIPSVVGPYTSVACTLSLVNSSIRKTAELLTDGDPYASTGLEDPRFEHRFGGLQSIVTSTAQNDSGLFEQNLRDDKLLPFEGAGAIGTWQIELPATLRQFDYDTIADVILHMRFTAREGGLPLRNAANATLNDRISTAAAAGSTRLFSVRHEFPTAWARFASIDLSPGELAELTFDLREDHYPFWSRGLTETVQRAALFAKTSRNTVRVAVAEDADPADAADWDVLERDPSFGGLRVGELLNLPLAAPTGTVARFLSDNTMQDLWLSVTWSPA